MQLCTGGSNEMKGYCATVYAKMPIWGPGNTATISASCATTSKGGDWMMHMCLHNAWSDKASIITCLRRCKSRRARVGDRWALS